jgi:hypothetical protein
MGARQLVGCGVSLLVGGTALLALAAIFASPPPSPPHNAGGLLRAERNRSRAASTRFGTLSWAQPYTASRCGTWPIRTASMREHIAAVGIPEPDGYGWDCVGHATRERMPLPSRRSTGVTTAACEAWCESTHDPDAALTGNWCCHWEPTAAGGDETGLCSWSDGLAIFHEIPPDRRMFASGQGQHRAAAGSGSGSGGRSGGRSSGSSTTAPRACLQPLAYEACTPTAQHFAAVLPDLATQGLANNRPRPQQPTSARGPGGGGRYLGAAAAAPSNGTADAEAGEAAGIKRERVRPRLVAERPPPSNCRLEPEHIIASLSLSSLGACSAACASWGAASPLAGTTADTNPCVAFAFSRARLAFPEAGAACILLSRCRDERGAPSEWEAYRRSNQDEMRAERLAPLQLGAPLGMSARLAGNAGAGGSGMTREERAFCPLESRAFVMEGEGAGTCSQLCVDTQWWGVAQREGVRRGECVHNGCSVYLATRKQAGNPFDLFRCHCPTDNQSMLYSCVSVGTPALT